MPKRAELSSAGQAWQISRVFPLLTAAEAACQEIFHKPFVLNCLWQWHMNGTRKPVKRELRLVASPLATVVYNTLWPHPMQSAEPEDPRPGPNSWTAEALNAVKLLRGILLVIVPIIIT